MAAISFNPSFWAGGWVQGQTNQRASRRRLVVTPCVVFFKDQRHVGLIRDISSNGLFAYTDFTPAIGDTVRITLTEQTGNGARTVGCSGIVVRVESKAAGAATGIALRVDAFQVM
jgi:PilZ domain